MPYATAFAYIVNCLIDLSHLKLFNMAEARLGFMYYLLTIHNCIYRIYNFYETDYFQKRRKIIGTKIKSH